MGFLDLDTQNQALLSKWLWKLDRDRESIWAQTIAELYQTSDRAQLALSTHCSFFLKSVLDLSPFYVVSIKIGSESNMVEWRWTQQGIFTTASAYEKLHDRGMRNITNIELWKLKIPLKVRLFIWVGMQNRLLTQQRLRLRGCDVPAGCHLCGNRLIETSKHLLFECTFAVRLWDELLNGWRVTRGRFANTYCWNLWWNARVGMRQQLRKLWDSLWAAGCWALWKERNARLFNRQQTPI